MINGTEELANATLNYFANWCIGDSVTEWANRLFIIKAASTKGPRRLRRKRQRNAISYRRNLTAPPTPGLRHRFKALSSHGWKWQEFSREWLIQKIKGGIRKKGPREVPARAPDGTVTALMTIAFWGRFSSSDPRDKKIGPISERRPFPWIPSNDPVR